jgi:hypothetical protein
MDRAVVVVVVTLPRWLCVCTGVDRTLVAANLAVGSNPRASYSYRAISVVKTNIVSMAVIFNP